MIFNLFGKQPWIKVEAVFADESRFNFKLSGQDPASNVLEKRLNRCRLILTAYVRILHNWQDHPEIMMSYFQLGDRLSELLLNKGRNDLIQSWNLTYDATVSDGKKYTVLLEDYAINLKSVETHFDIGDEIHYVGAALIAWIFAATSEDHSLLKALGRGIKKLNNKIMKQPEQNLNVLAEEVSQEVSYS